MSTAEPDYVTVVPCMDKRRYLAVLMRYEPSSDSYTQRECWGPYVRELAETRARIEAKERGVEIK